MSNDLFSLGTLVKIGIGAGAMYMFLDWQKKKGQRNPEDELEQALEDEIELREKQEKLLLAATSRL